jgi:hypothetical protein
VVTTELAVEPVPGYRLFRIPAVHMMADQKSFRQFLVGKFMAPVQFFTADLATLSQELCSGLFG